ncbi:MAG: penicillin-binding protein 1A [Gammaproteobacteria bacterium]|nr:penicillin-binding protein 1A [Gammaproteobacteria bacterium]
MKLLIKILKTGLWLLLSISLASTTALAVVYFYLAPNLPSPEELREVELQVPLRVYTRDLKLIAEFGEKRREPLTYTQVPELMVQSFLAAEDGRFFEHPGVDYQGILRAVYQLIVTGEKRQGGSTITMQVARNFFLSREKTYIRKLNEILLALKIEREFTKEEILELYLNKIYMGHRAYGVGAAAKVYYGKSVEEISLPQIAMIAGLPKAPSRFNPITDPDRALLRRNYVLDRMRELNYITEEQYQAARKTGVTAYLHAANIEVVAPYVAEMVRAELFSHYQEKAYTGGYSVYTTLDSRRQTTANMAVRSSLQAYDKRHGYRAPEKQSDISLLGTDEALDTALTGYRPIGKLRPAIVVAVADDSAEVYLGKGERIQISWKGLEWARPYKNVNRRGAKPKKAQQVLAPGDLVRIFPETDKKKQEYWRLAQIPKADGALVALDPDDGAVVSLTGGYDFYNSKFNRVTQAKRQPGSGFKAFIYSAALEAGFTPASLINDAPVVFDDPSLEGAWRPKNYSGKFFGPTRLRYALTKSRNLVSIRLLRSMGVEHALKHASLFGFDADQLPHNLSLALGSGNVTPLQMATAYAILSNGGYRVEPYFIDRVEDSQSNVLYQSNPLRVCEDCPENPPESAINPESGNSERIAPRVISTQNHYLMNSMMRDVITRGTATKARALGRKDLAGKTGTTNDQKDAWFNGFTRSLVAISWVGFDSATPLGRGEVGGKAALPAWMIFMKEALKDAPEVPLKMPPGIITVRIDPNTGNRAATNQKNAIFEVFRIENAPAENGRGMISQRRPSGGAAGTETDHDPF